MIDESHDSTTQTDAKLMALYGLITSLVMAADRRGIATDLLDEAVEIADGRALKFQSLAQFSGQGEQVLNEIEELRQFLLNGISLPQPG